MPKEPKSKQIRAGKVKKSPATDPSTWRQSNIKQGTTISTTYAQKLYRLKPSEFKTLPHTVEETVVSRGEQNEPGIVHMHLYNERDIEAVAWKKHGSPEGFEFYLNALEESWKKKKKPYEQFPQPRSYCRPSPGGYVAIVRASPSKRVDPAVSTPTLLRCKSQFPDWLWTTCDRALWSDSYETHYFLPIRKREEAMSSIFHPHKGLRQYPCRPNTKLPSSLSVDALRLVLDDAPSVSMGQYPEGSGHKFPDRYLHVEHDGFSGDDSCSWAEVYRDMVFRALINVINEHGLGGGGWESVRWEVYDKYAEYMAGISYDDGYWFDGAKSWLEGRLTIEELEKDEMRGDCKSGRKYNRLLPKNAPGV